MRLSYNDLLGIRDRLVLIEEIQAEYYLIKHGKTVVLAEGKHDNSLEGVIKYIRRLDANIQRIKSGDHRDAVRSRMAQTADCSDLVDVLNRMYS